MDKHYVGSEIGQLRSVMLHRPNLSLKRLTPSNCQELLFDDVLSVERAGEEHDVFANTERPKRMRARADSLKSECSAARPWHR